LLFDTTEERDGLLAHGGERGMKESYARLDALLTRLISNSRKWVRGLTRLAAEATSPILRS
jgi:hypothetical protein